MLAGIDKKGEWVVYKIRLKSFRYMLDVQDSMDTFFDLNYRSALNGFFLGVYKREGNNATLVVGIHSKRMLAKAIEKWLEDYDDDILAIEVHYPEKQDKKKKRIDDYWLCNGFLWNWYSYQIYRTLKKHFEKHVDVREFDRYSYNHLSQMIHRIMNNLGYNYSIEVLLYSEMLTHFIRNYQTMEGINERFIDETKDMRL